MQAYYEKKKGLLKSPASLNSQTANQKSANHRFMTSQQDRNSANISPATYSPKKDLVM